MIILMQVNSGYQVMVTLTDRPPNPHQPITDTVSHHALPGFIMTGGASFLSSTGLLKRIFVRSLADVLSNI